MTRKLVFNLQKVDDCYIPVTVKCNVLNLRQVGEVLDGFLDEISVTLLKEQKQLIKEVNNSKIPSKRKQKFVKILKSGLISDADMEFIKANIK